MLVELYKKLSFLAKTQSMTSGTQYVQELWKQLVNTVPGDFALLCEINEKITPKAFEMIKNQASLFPRYRVSPFDSTKEGYYVMYDSPSAPSKCLLSSTNDGYKITYVSKEKRQEIVCLDEGLSDFSSVSFVDAKLKSFSC